MSSLAVLPEIIGFFSYSRDDDESFKGTLSALRDAIQRELGAQLGRSKKTFRLWQDQESIAPGKLWKSEIDIAIEQSVFFIPLITPRMVNSKFCKEEFDAFIAREQALGRNDLIFPILYITTPGLGDERSRNDPVLLKLSTVQYVDWRPLRHLDVNSTVVREAVERFCRKIVEALDVPWAPPEERFRHEEIEIKRPAEEHRGVAPEASRRIQEKVRGNEDEVDARRLERRHREAENPPGAHEDKLQKKLEVRQPTQTEGRPPEAATWPHPDQLNQGAQSPRASATRAEAYKEAMSTNNPTVLKAFLDRFPIGASSDQVRDRLKTIEDPVSKHGKVVSSVVRFIFPGKIFN
jgi:hypothetical protein